MKIASLAVLIVATGVEGFTSRPFPSSTQNFVGFSARQRGSRLVTPRGERKGKCSSLRMVLDIPREKSAKKLVSPSSPTPAVTLNDALENKIDGSQELGGRNNIISAEGLTSISSEVKSEEIKDINEMKPELSLASEEDKSETALKAPGVANIIKFAIPATGVWLCGPLLSLIDTAAVGLLAGTSHQAALSPAVAVTDYSALLLAFLYAATTNLVAASKSKSSSSDATNNNVDNAPPQETLLSSLQLSLLVGAGLGSALFVLSKVLLKTLIGSGNITPAVFLPAVRYVKIRALGMPAAAVLGSAQAACLGLKDIRSPLLVLMSAAVINLLGDMVFVGCKHSLLHGAAGAAWATVFSQYAAVVFFLHWLKTKSSSGEGRSVGKRLSQAGSAVSKLLGKKEAEVTSGTASEMVPEKMSRVKDEKKKPNKADSNVVPPRKKQAKTFSTRGYLSEQNFRKRDILSLPPKKAASKFLSYVIPVTTTSVGRVSLFLTMAHVVASCMGTVGMAAQQIVLAMFEAVGPLADSMSLTAQSFVPVLQKRAHESKENAAELMKTTKQFFRAGAVFSAIIVSIVSCIPIISRFFSKDPMVVASVNSIAPFLAGIFALHGITMASEGVLLGSRDLGFLGRMYSGIFCVLPTLMLRAKRAHQLGKTTLSLRSIWKIFLVYEMSRVILWSGRAWWLAKRKSIQADGCDASQDTVKESTSEHVISPLDDSIPVTGTETGDPVLPLSGEHILLGTENKQSVDEGTILQ